MEDVSNPQRLHQLYFVQSFVLDLKVNQVIRSKGFDMSPIESDQMASIHSLCRALESGYRPPHRREEVFMALLLASQLLDENREKSDLLVAPGQALVEFRRLDGSLANLAMGFTDAVRKHGYQDRDGIRKSIDECLMLAFEHSGDAIDLETDLIVPSVDEPNFDKHPQWIAGAPVRLKVEVGRAMAKEEVPDGSRWILSRGPGGKSLLGFELPDGSRQGPWLLDHPFPFDTASDTLRMMEINRKNRERMMNQMRPSPTVTRFPNVGGFPPHIGNRHYMAGLGRFLTQARLEEQLAGEHPYGYALNNPTTHTDPTGLRVCFCELWGGIGHTFISTDRCGAFGTQGPFWGSGRRRSDEDLLEPIGSGRKGKPCRPRGWDVSCRELENSRRPGFEEAVCKCKDIVEPCYFMPFRCCISYAWSVLGCAERMIGFKPLPDPYLEGLRRGRTAVGPM